MKISKLTPNLEVSDIKDTVAFYLDILGFNLVMAVPHSQDSMDQKFSPEKEYVYAMVQKDNVEIMFQRSDSFKNDVVFAENLPIGASVSFYMDVEGIAELYEDLKNKGQAMTVLKTSWYGMKEFYMKDPNGYILGFAEKSE
ncbi:bleomycin resistance family protein [Flavobacterium suaedae]|uniref:Bleomycin resistance family protein n=1 Tax=Flavobacterium suaedae TaxID=1767027 RepID=A0ABQ1K1G0_9FLAO|nr:VOC family protein [Flavobacterium suaedae]GGB81365.1 bleomycin resistance family protein [Flavobacterium suaedae]